MGPIMEVLSRGGDRIRRRTPSPSGDGTPTTCIEPSGVPNLTLQRRVSPCETLVTSVEIDPGMLEGCEGLPGAPS